MKCTDVIERREKQLEEFQEQQKQEDIRKAKEEALKEQAENAEQAREEEQELSYQELLMKYRVEFGMASEEEFENFKKDKKKK